MTLAREDKIQEDFERFHAHNPRVYRLFDRFTRECIAKGQRRGSAKAIFERIRWEYQVELRDSLATVPKLNNNYTSRYARLWCEFNPEHKGFFRKRKLSPISANSVKHADPIYGEP